MTSSVKEKQERRPNRKRKAKRWNCPEQADRTLGNTCRGPNKKDEEMAVGSESKRGKRERDWGHERGERNFIPEKPAQPGEGILFTNHWVVTETKHGDASKITGTR